MEEVFEYEAMDAVGQSISGEVSGTQEAVIAKIRSRGHFPTKVFVKNNPNQTIYNVTETVYKKIYEYGRWHKINCCASCNEVLTREEIHYSDGICPFCGEVGSPQKFRNIDLKTEVNVIEKVRRWNKTTPWWMFWSKRGYWEYK